jgi:3D (Asp-Asp-Asp) domain-containing protein
MVSDDRQCGICANIVRNLSYSARSTGVLLRNCGTVPAVLGQAHTPQRRLLPVAAFALAVLIAPAVGGANPAHSVSSLRAHDAAIAAKARSSVLGLYSLDQQLAAANAHLAALRGQAVSLRAERATLRTQLTVARRGTSLAQRQLGLRIRALYDQGSVEPLEIVFGSKSLDEAMSNIESLSRSAGQGQDVLRQLKSARRQLAATSHALASREASLAAATRSAEATAAQLAAARAERTAYIASLAAERRLTQREISSVVARAHEAQVRSAQLVQVRTTSAPAPAPITTVVTEIAPATGQSLTVSATGYALGGHTATGLPVGYGIAAVDPSVIPLGTHFTVPGYGEAIAADTGGAIVGDTIDLWFPSVAQAESWGRRTVTIVLH